MSVVIGGILGDLTEHIGT